MIFIVFPLKNHYFNCLLNILFKFDQEVLISVAMELEEMWVNAKEQDFYSN